MPYGSYVEDFSVRLLGNLGNNLGIRDARETYIVYAVGDIIDGYLNLELLQHLCLTCIRITIKGRAFVHWTEQNLRGAGEPRFKDTRHHSASEDYFEQSLVLFGQTKNDKLDKCYLPAGRYTYPFHYQLPAHLPCSFEGEYGYVRYWVKAVIEKGFEQCHVTKMPFTVISPLDLNAVPESNSPIHESTEKKLCCFCCMSGPISAMLCLQKRGFVPGEQIRFGAELSNLSSRKMGSYSVELKMTTIFKTPTKSRNITKQVCKVKRHSVGRGETDKWMCDQLVIPPLPPSYLLGCSIITVKYNVKTTVFKTPTKSRSITKQVCKVKRHSVGRGETDTWMCDQLVIPPLPPSCLLGCSIITVKYNVELRVDPVGPAFDLILPIDVIIGTIPHRPHHDHSQYANVQYSPSSSPHGSQYSSARNSHARGVPLGVPVLPVQGGHLIVNPAHALHSASHTNCLYPVTSGATGQSQQHQRHQVPPPPPPRPSSRASSSQASTSSTLSLNQTHASAIFAESAFGRVSIRFEEDSDHNEGHVKYAPVYPYYQRRK